MTTLPLVYDPSKFNRIGVIIPLNADDLKNKAGLVRYFSHPVKEMKGFKYNANAWHSLKNIEYVKIGDTPIEKTILSYIEELITRCEYQDNPNIDEIEFLKKLHTNDDDVIYGRMF